MQLCFAHGALQPQQEPVIEQRRVIEAVAIADQRVGEAGEIDEAIPFGIVAGQARDFQTEHEVDTGERHLGRTAMRRAARLRPFAQTGNVNRPRARSSCGSRQ